MRVVAFNGSPRRHGNTAALLTLVGEELAREGIACEIVQLGGHAIHGCIACMRCREPAERPVCALADDPINGYLDLIEAADGLLIGSPVYFAGITPEVKAFIDRIGYVSRSRPDMLRRKAGAAVVVNRRAGALTAYDTINHLFGITEMIVPGSSYWNLSVALHPDDWKKDEEGQGTMRTLGQNMAWLLKRIRG